ncbi:hypothetical protein M513_11737 [Trichuris suis]|uniref:Uncharacterized protein n=1 Tax=Trichuris suis TaxID=68888 RepID=A0A085LQX8_9BILA|nr:hypothetical protein M513_11737 [Trichuris suis]
MVKYAKLLKAAFSWLCLEEMEYQDVKDILNYQQDELTTDELQGKQKGEKNQMMMKIRKLLRSMTTAELSDAALETTEQRLQWLEDNGSNAERSRTARRGVRELRALFIS